MRKALTVAVLAGLSIASACGDDESDLPVKQIAERVERIRGLEFEHVPEVRLLGEEEFVEESTKVARASAAAQKIDLAQAKRNLAVARQLLFITGLLTPDEIAQATSSGGGDLAGLYSFKTNELLVLDKGSRRSRESTVAHELTHALEDQALGSRLTTTLSPFSDRASAYQSLLEGSATLVQIRYAQRYLGARGSLEHRLAKVERRAASSKLPEMLAAATVFPYVQGTRFAQALERQGGWKLIDKAHDHPPTTTSSILHPNRFLAGERRVSPHLGASGLGDGWTKLGLLELGEFDTLLLLKSGVSDSDADTIAAGWAGGTVEAYRHGRPGACEAPCRDKVALRIGWSWRSPGAARAFAEAMPEWFTRALSAQGHDSWELDGGAAALSVQGRETHLAFAPTVSLARALAGD